MYGHSYEPAQSINPDRHGDEDTGSSRKLVYGTVAGVATLMSVDETDYIEQGYATSKGTGHVLVHAFIPKNTRRIEFQYRGNYCAFRPFSRKSQEEDLPGAAWITLQNLRRPRLSFQTVAMVTGMALLLLLLWRRKIMGYQRRNRPPPPARAAPRPQTAKMNND
tara:strand:- start:1658 stop:2149 length:492 start_codon:yes stop_codon:yes gene_type:complete